VGRRRERKVRRTRRKRKSKARRSKRRASKRERPRVKRAGKIKGVAIRATVTRFNLKIE
tara:strand:- start:3389 stop:3565 length:177 start_codon:yes stop_codon:yes gene_type:complete